MKRLLFALLLVFAVVLAPLARFAGEARAQANIIYVNDDSPEQPGDGLSWETAYFNLQIALSAAEPGDQIWVAAGTYKPNFDILTGQYTNDRYATFLLPDGVAVYGGFAGTETSLAQRANWRANPSILSGDLLGDDTGPALYNAANRQDNAYNVVQMHDVDETTRLDGFIITGGNANLGGTQGFGGGLHIELALARFANLDVVNNSALGGGGMFAHEYSGSMANIRFLGNNAQVGGGLNVYSSPLTLQNGVFSGNSATSWCGGLKNASNSGVTLVNVTFSNNTATHGKAACNSDSSMLWVMNSIFGSGQSIVDNDSHSQVSYSVVEDPYSSWLEAIVAGGGGVHSVQAGVSPLLAQPSGADNLPGTLDDNLALISNSPAKDAGDTSSLLADLTDLDQDGSTSEPAPFDLAGRLRRLGTKPDAGAYELPAVPLVTLGANEGVTYFEETVTLTAQVTSPSSVPTGSVTFWRGAQELATVALNSSGAAVYVLNGLNAGTHTFTARYNGDFNYRTAVSQPIQKSVEPIEVTVSVTADRTGVVVGQPVAFSAQADPLTAVQTPLIGTIRIRDADENNLCSYSFPAETGCAYAFADPGAHAIYAVFQSATSNFVNTPSPEKTIIVSAAETDIQITGISPATMARAGTPVTVNFAVTVAPPGSAPLEGTVTITSAEDAAATCSAPAASGSCAITFPAVGIHTLTAAFEETTRLGGSTSKTVTYRVRGEDAYVDDDGLCGANFPCFTSIAGAIADVNAGHSVFVYRGTYSDLLLNKDVTVQVDDDVVVLGDVTVDAGTLNITPFGRLTVQGDFVRGGSGTVTASGPVTLNGPGDQRLGVEKVKDLTIRDSSLLAYWPMDEEEDGFIYEVATYPNWSFQYFGQRHAGEPGPLAFSRDTVRFTGLDAPLFATMDVPETEMTVSFWFRTDQANAGLYEIADGVSDYIWFDRSIFLSGGNVCAYLWGVDESSETICSSGSNYADGQWHHVAHAFGASVGGQHLYLDGAKKASGVQAASDFAWQRFLLLGQSFKASENKRATAQVDDLRLYSRALTAGDAYLLANGSPAVKTVALKTDLEISGNFFLQFAGLDVADPDESDIISRSITLKGDWTNQYGALDAREGTVTLTGTSQAVYGSNTFYNLTRSGAGALSFASGDLQTVLGTLALRGENESARLLLGKMGAGSWKIDARGPLALEYLLVSDTANAGAERIDATSGNNLPGSGTTGWNFYAPQHGSLYFTAVEEQETTLALTATDSDGDDVTFTVGTLPAHGTLYHTTEDGKRGAAVQAGETLARPALIYTFTTSGPAAVSFGITASDGQAASPAPVTLALNNVNDRPVAADDAYETDEDDVLLVQAGNGLLVNDTDEEGNPLSVVIENWPDHGSLQLISEGSFAYMPDHNFNGTDTFIYHVWDGSSSNAAVVTITVNPVDDPTVARMTEIPGNILEGETATFTVSLIDPDNGQTVPFSAGAQITWDFGDGSTASGASVQQVYADNHDAATVSARIVDAENGINTTLSTMIQVLNAAPEITGPGPQKATERFAFSREVAFADPGQADTWTVTIDYGDGSETETLEAAGGKFTLSHVYTTAGEYEIAVTLADDDGGETSLVVPVTVDTVFVMFTPIMTR